MRKSFFLFVFCVLTTFQGYAQTSSDVPFSLAGEWKVTMDNADKSAKIAHFIGLPGTIDTRRLGYAPHDTLETTHLTRLYGYKGAALYERDIDIPKAWKGQKLQLFLERTKPSWLYIDGIRMDSCNDICTPQRYILQPLKPGKHHLGILVDNSRGIPQQIYASSHMYSEDTQTNWNGVIGEISLQPLQPFTCSQMLISGQYAKRQISLSYVFDGNIKKGKVAFEIYEKDAKGISTLLFSKEMGSESTFNGIIQLPTEVEIESWDEFSPHLYIVKLLVNKEAIASKTFGFIDFEAKNHHFYANGKMTFLRGKHDACVWPQIGHTPMDTASWVSYFKTLRDDYGINHIRFHSWCPPEAAFEAADELGIYLQPELPFWGDFNEKDTTLMTFLRKEGVNILREYGHHPSFRMLALGNELWGSIDEMGRFLTSYRQIYPSKLYTFGSNYGLGWQGIKPGIDYFTTCRNGGEAWGNYNTHTRGSFGFCDAYEGGILNHFYPNSSRNFDAACDAANVPIISHETGQFQTYPDFSKEMAEYMGVLYPYNMGVFQRRLAANGMADEALAFHEASGKWAAELYKADIEMDLGTKNMSGFQLLDIQDYPGQGSAYVGILDANMQPKGTITPKEWRQFCAPMVSMLKMDKFCYSVNEHFKAKFLVANYFPQHFSKITPWCLQFGVKDSNWNGVIRQGLTEVGEIDEDLSLKYGPIKHPVCVTLKIGFLDDTGTWQEGWCNNTYRIWIYPVYQKEKKKDIVETSVLSDEIGKQLMAGTKVLWMPDSMTFVKDSALLQNTVGGLFETDYWNYRMFKTICENNKKAVSPGTLGLYIANPKHPIFTDFPTDNRTSWQWFAPVKQSRPLILDNFDNAYRPIVQVIDNIERNHRLGLIFEFAVGKGKLLVCMSDLRKTLQYPEGQSLYHSILNYMDSSDFQPSTSITWKALKTAVYGQLAEKKLQDLNNISQY